MAYSGSAYWLRITTPTSGWVVRSSSASLMPSSVFVGGIQMSVRTTSGTTSLDGQAKRGEVAACRDDLDVLLLSRARQIPSRATMLSSPQNDANRHGVSPSSS